MKLWLKIPEDSDHDSDDDLMSNNLVYVGTLRENKTYVPEAFEANRRRKMHSTVFGFHNDDNNDTCMHCGYSNEARGDCIL